MLDYLWLIIGAFFLISSLSPVIQRRMMESARVRSIQRIEQTRKSRVITLIHRQEAVALLGLPIARYIDIEDSEQVLRAIKLTPPDLPLDIILHTPGGLVLAAEQIAHALVRHKGKVTVFVPHYAMSGGMLVSMAADEIVMDENAVLGPVDPQLGEYPAASILEVLDAKPIAEIDDRTIILASVARKALRQVHSTVVEILTANGMDQEKATFLADTLSTGRWTHDYPINFEEAKALGLPVSDQLPREVYELMSLYPQAGGRRPSVQYIPVPYSPQPRPEPAPARRDQK
jgi:ClpP class serine protease